MRLDLIAVKLAEACPAARQGQAGGRQLASAGIGSTMLTRCLRSGLVLRLRRGSYALGALPTRGRHLLKDGNVDLGFLADVRSVLTSLGGDCVADRRTAAVLWQMDMLVEPREIDVRVPRTRTRVALPGVRARVSSASSAFALEVAGLEAVLVVPALDTVLDCAEDRPLLEGIVIADSALRRGLVTVDDLVRGVAARVHKRNVRKLRRLLELVDPDSGSVLESVLRFLLVMNGLHPTSQYVVKSRKGATVGRVDFCFEAERLIIECDGRRWHDPEDARDRDRTRDNGMARAGWRVLRFSWTEVRQQAGYVLECVREALLPAAA